MARKKKAAPQKPANDVRLAARQELSRNWRGPRSFCVCGHQGDGSPSWHTNTLMPGHGNCFHPDCKGCPKFRWKRFTPDYEAALARIDGKTRKRAQ